MKKIAILFTAVLMGLTSVSAAENSSAQLTKDLDLTSRYRYTQPVTFIERGVEFLIFADGRFDFNTNVISLRRAGLYFQRNTRRRSINVPIGTPGTLKHHYGSRGILVNHDRLGRLKRVGNVFINYDQYGRIKRVGSVNVSYRQGFLRQVGGLKLQYNRNGRLIHTKGFVNRNNQDCNFCGNAECDIDHRERFDDFNRWENDYIDNDNFYYFKQNGKVKKQKKLNSKRRR